MSSPTAVPAGGSGCWDDNTGTGMGTVCDRMADRLRIGAGLWLFSSCSPGKVLDFRWYFGFGCGMVLSFLRFWGVSGGFTYGLFCCARFGRGLLGDECGTVDAACFSENMADFAVALPSGSCIF